MSRPSADVNGVHVALIGADTVEGTRVREVLARSGVPGARVDLYGTTHGEVLLSEYAGEARLIQEPDLAEVLRRELIFLCERGPFGESLADAVGPDHTVVDVIGGLPDKVRPPLIHMDLNPEAAHGQRGFFAVPHPLAILLGELLFPLDRRLGIEEVVAVVLRPAADWGERGIEELREQTVRLLNFAELPITTFGRQLAFNIIPQIRLSGEAPSVEQIVAAQVARLLGWERPRLSVRLLAAPLFYGHGLELRLRTRNGADVEALREALREAGFREGSDEAPANTPMDVADERETRIADLSADELGGFWVFAVAGGTGTRTAEQAVRLARSLSDL